MTLALILLIAALILAILAALTIPTNRISLGWSAFACYIGYVLINHGVVG